MHDMAYINNRLGKELLQHRVIFCSYWLYFSTFRSFVEGQRLFDYLGISLLFLGLLYLHRNRWIDLKLVKWISIIMCPIFIAIILEPSIHAFIFIFKAYIIAVYFSCYFKSIRLSMVELVCFSIPIFANFYFFIFPKASYYIYNIRGRMAGISEPNFTSLSLIISICGALGIYVLSDSKRIKVGALAAALISFIGVLLTASRAGLLSAIIAISIFLLIRFKTPALACVVFLVFLFIQTFGIDFTISDKPFVFERFQKTYEKANDIDDALAERFFTVDAWDKIKDGAWFSIGLPDAGGSWEDKGIEVVPHNSFLDIGIQFGKASFYFSCALFFVLFFINIRVLLKSWHCRYIEEKYAMLTPLLFFSLMPTYMTLSTGMTMPFIFWMTLGTYPLFQHTHNSAFLYDDPLNYTNKPVEYHGNTPN